MYICKKKTNQLTKKIKRHTSTANYLKRKTSLCNCRITDKFYKNN